MSRCRDSPSRLSCLSRSATADSRQTSPTRTSVGQIVHNVGDIATDVGDIATDVGNIATDVSDIATDVGDIATDVGDIAMDVGDIAMDVDNVATKVDVGVADAPALVIEPVTLTFRTSDYSLSLAGLYHTNEHLSTAVTEGVLSAREPDAGHRMRLDTEGATMIAGDECTRWTAFPGSLHGADVLVLELTRSTEADRYWRQHVGARGSGVPVQVGALRAQVVVATQHPALRSAPAHAGPWCARHEARHIIAGGMGGVVLE
ncbi:hypothetical protein DENSPDRAFT_911385 [Dentipellis sp. KUC8613]|nr:hypothetical protein DENSPDRAFT_911385 [Dentipellis sp. KUC8613]